MNDVQFFNKICSTCIDIIKCMMAHGLIQLICCQDYGMQDRGKGFRFQTGARDVFFLLKGFMNFFGTQ
jgi:hypothetical protein